MYLFVVSTGIPVPCNRQKICIFVFDVTKSICILRLFSDILKIIIDFPNSSLLLIFQKNIDNEEYAGMKMKVEKVTVLKQ